MGIGLTTKKAKGVKLFYTNPYTSQRFDDQSVEYPLPEVANLLSRITSQGITLITTMPSGLGLDFHSEHDGSIWVEFYGDVLQSTFVNLATAGEILARAFNSTTSGPVRENFSDLVPKWEY